MRVTHGVIPGVAVKTEALFFLQESIRYAVSMLWHCEPSTATADLLRTGQALTMSRQTLVGESI
jgi:hypothetical protein